MIDPEVVSPILKGLMLKVFTPIMAFTYAFFIMIAYVMFRAYSVDPSWDFGTAIWVWCIVALAFTPLLGAIMWVQTVKALGKKKPSSKSKPKPKPKPAQES